MQYIYYLTISFLAFSLVYPAQTEFDLARIESLSREALYLFALPDAPPAAQNCSVVIQNRSTGLLLVKSMLCNYSCLNTYRELSANVSPPDHIIVKVINACVPRIAYVLTSAERVSDALEIARVGSFSDTALIDGAIYIIHNFRAAQIDDAPGVEFEIEIVSPDGPSHRRWWQLTPFFEARG
jgi:hypothetical protein